MEETAREEAMSARERRKGRLTLAREGREALIPHPRHFMSWNMEKRIGRVIKWLTITTRKEVAKFTTNCSFASFRFWTLNRRRKLGLPVRSMKESTRL